MATADTGTANAAAWGDVPTWFSALVALAALVLGLWSFVASRRDARRAAADAAAARAAAERATLAAEKTAEAAARHAAIAEAEASKYPAPWRLHAAASGRFRLANDSSENVHDIVIVFPPMPDGEPDEELRGELLTPGSAIEFTKFLTLGRPHRDITVTWSREPRGERHSWTHPLPG